jgi:hypothetical protein
MVAAETILILLMSYVLCGLPVAVAFVVAGVGRVDEAARGTGLGFRLLILPGTVALWPLMLANWFQAHKAEGHA